MKFILNEKYILSEKFILHEDDTSSNGTAEQIKTDLEQITELLDLAINNPVYSIKAMQASTNAKLDEIQQILVDTQLWSNEDKLLAEIEPVLEANLTFIQECVLACKASTVQQKYKQLVQIIEDSATRLNRIKANIDTLKNTQQHHDTLAILKAIKLDYTAFAKTWNDKQVQHFAKNSHSIYKIRDLLKQLREQYTKYGKQVAFVDALPDPYKQQFKTIADNCLAQITKIRTSLTKAIKDLDQIPTAIDWPSLEADTTALVNQLTTINNKITLWQQELPELDIKDKTPYLAVDWKNEFARAVQQDKALGGKSRLVDHVWAKYYRMVWDAYDKKTLAAINQVLTPELLHFGYTEKTNPFIVYLKNILKHPNVNKRLMISPINYARIHNAFLDNLITEDDLRGDGALGKVNVIFCPELYDFSNADMQQYIEKQAIACKLFEDYDFATQTTAADGAGSELNMLTAKYKTGSADDLKHFISDLFYNGSSSTPGKTTVASLARQEGNITKGLKPLSSITKELQICFDQADVSAVTTNVFDNKYTNMANSILITSKNVQQAAKTIFSQAKEDSLNWKTTVHQIMLAIIAHGKASGLTDEQVQQYKTQYNIGNDRLPDTKDMAKIFKTYMTPYALPKDSKEICKPLLDQLNALYKARE